MMKLAWYWYVLIGIVSIAAIYGIYEFLNEKHIEKYGYPILDFEFLPMAIGSGSVIRIGCWWREYALHHAKNMLYPNLFLGFFIFGAIFLLLGYCMKYYQKKAFRLVEYSNRYYFRGSYLLFIRGIDCHFHLFQDWRNSY